MYVLGLSCYYHDSAAALLKDGITLAAAQEERFTRKKHDNSFPLNAIEYCLQEAGITAKQIDKVAFYEKPLLKFDRLLHTFLHSFPRGFSQFHNSIPSMVTQKLRLNKTLKKKLKYTDPIIYVEHHLSHAASAFFSSGFPEAAILTNDGVGEWTCSAVGVANGNKLKLLKEIQFPHSLGLFYSTMTSFLGFMVNNDEYKVMGLAAYGTPRYVDLLKKTINSKPDGSYSLNMEYFSYHYNLRMFSNALIELLGTPRRPESTMTQYYEDIAASVQSITEEIVLNQIKYIASLVKTPYLCMAGGVSLNSVANGKILQHTPFSELYIHPASGDSGGAIGAAQYAYHVVLGNDKPAKLDHVYFGPQYSEEYIRNFLISRNITFTELENDTFIQKVGKLLSTNYVIGWFQGRMEWGPRALGARSILSNAMNVKMKDILNAKVKHRELFRPFAPVITAEDAPLFFNCDIPAPSPADFMLVVYPIKKKWHSIIPAVTHVDGTGRVQTIRRTQNTKYYDVIKEYENHTGIPILVNTSFNIRGEPIVCSPEDAYRCMMGTGIDVLAIGNFVVWRKDNPLDMWDSEKGAHETKENHA